MLNLLEQTIVGFTTILAVRLVESRLAVKRLRCLDQTEEIKDRLSPAVAQLLHASHTRVLRILRQNNAMIAQTRLVFPKTSVYVDYNERDVSRDFEDFVIAHEIGHIRGHHVLIKLSLECIAIGFVTAIAITLTASNPSVMSAAFVAVPVILLGIIVGFIPLDIFLTWLTEFDADRFAARLVGREKVLKQLGLMKCMFSPNRRILQSNLNDRIARLTRFES